MPFTGPFNTVVSGEYSDYYQSRYRQPKPYKSALPYQMRRTEGRDRHVSTELGTDTTSKNTSFGFWSMSQAGTHYGACYNQAYAKFQSKISDSAGWGENLAQYKSAARMFNTRAEQAWEITKRFRRDIGGTSIRGLLLRPDVRRSGDSAKKSIASQILEYEYGLSPLISDFQSSYKILTSDPGTRKVHGSSSSFIQEFNQAFGPGTYERTLERGKVDVHLRARARVINPNLFLAVRLGLLDVALPWKLLPFSFVVDWFVNVEQCFSSLTDTFGLSIEDPHVTVFTRASLDRFTRSEYQWNGNPHSVTTYRNIASVSMDRVQGIPTPDLTIKPFKGFSIQRGLQAISLVLVTLGR